MSAQIIPLKLPTGTNQGRSGQAANARLVNCFAEQAGDDAKSGYVIYEAPGLARFDQGPPVVEDEDDELVISGGSPLGLLLALTTSTPAIVNIGGGAPLGLLLALTTPGASAEVESAAFSGAMRGLIELNSNALIAFLGNEVISFDRSGFPTTLGTLVGSGRLSMARNRATVPQIAVVTNAKQYYVLSGGVLTQVSDTDLPPPECVEYSNGFFLFGIQDGRIFASDLENGLSIQADASGAARSDASDLRKIKAHAGYVYVFKAEGTEIWKADPALSETTFPFSPVQQNISIGIGAADSVAELSKGLAWVDDKFTVRLGKDGSAVRISNHTIERAIEALTDRQRRSLEAFSFSYQGHEIYSLSSDDWTWQFDLTTERWNSRASYGSARWRATACEQFNGAYIVGDTGGGRLYRIDPEVHTEDGDPLVLEIWFPHSHRFPGGMKVHDVYTDMIKGTGSLIGDDQAMLDYSDDGGVTFEGQVQESFGLTGERRKRVRFGSFGSVRENGRIWRLSISAPVQRGVIQTYLKAAPLK